MSLKNFSRKFFLMHTQIGLHVCVYVCVSLLIGRMIGNADGGILYLLSESAQLCPTPLSIAIFRQEYQSGLPFAFPGDLSNPGLNLCLFFFFFLNLSLSSLPPLVNCISCISYIGRWILYHWAPCLKPQTLPKSISAHPLSHPLSRWKAL